MRLRTALLIALFFTINASAQDNPKVEDVSKMTWLVGSWKGIYQGRPFYEAWRKLDNNTLLNFNIEIKGTDTIVKESTAIIIKDGKAVYGNSPDQWGLKRLTDNEMMLEMDPPKFHGRIIWLHTKDDHWLTIIQQPKSTVHYDIVRVPELEAVVDRYMATVKK